MMSGRALISIVAALGIGFSATSEVEIHKRLETYDVSARDFRSLEKRIISAKTKPFPQRYAGLTTTLLTWEADFEETPEGCRVVDWTVTVDTVIQLPDWVGVDKASEADQARWDLRRRTLESHEAFHHQMSVEAAYLLDEEIGLIGTAATCDALSSSVSKLYSAVAEILDTDHQFYDALSDHGRKQDRYFSYLKQQRAAAQARYQP